MLYSIRDHSFRSLKLYLLLIVTVSVLALSGCEDPGSVGESITESDPEVVIDTLTLAEIDTSRYNHYSGAFTFFSAGSFNDPLFGSMEAIGMVKPNLPSSDDTVETGASMKMRIIINGAQIYGDSLADQEFNIYQIDEIWRGRSWKLKDDISFDRTEAIASFTIGSDEDSLDVALDNSWVERYRQYASGTSSNADSSYQREFFGLAVVPDNSNKIVALDSRSTRFVIENPEADTITVGLNQWAYSLDRTSAGSTSSEFVPLLSTFESVINFDADFSDVDFQALDIAKAEFVLYENKDFMDQSLSSNPSSTARPAVTSARLHLVNPNETPENIASGNPITGGRYVEADSAFHFGITRPLQNFLLNEIPEDQQFYVTIPNNGVIKPSLIYTGSGGVMTRKRPKIIVTSLKNNSN